MIHILLLFLLQVVRGMEENNSSSPVFSVSPITQYLPHDSQLSEYSAANIVVQKMYVDTPVSSPDCPPVTSDPAQVLLLHPIYAGSHEVVLRNMALEMVKRGHKVTQLRWKTDHQPINIKRHMAEAEQEMASERSHLDIVTISVQNRDLRFPYISADGSLQPPTKLLWDTERSIFNVPTDVFKIIDAQCSTLLGDKALMSALNASSFTVAFVDLISNECSLALARHLGLPVVAYWGFPLQGGEARRLGMHQSPAIVPMMMSEFGATMTFWERFVNTVLAFADEALFRYHTYITNHWIQKLHPGLPSSATLLAEIDALLVSVDWAVDYPKLLPPNIHYIGCLMCRPGNQLDQQLQDWMESAGDAGVIIFSFGLTGFDPNVVPLEFRMAVLTALEELPQKVVLHFDPSKLDYVPSNVLARKMLPQQDLLAHSQSKLFVSHCGMNSVNEAIYHAVPLVCVPNFADQGDIAQRVVERGFGVSVAKKGLTNESLKDAMAEVFTNPRYREKTEATSFLWKSQKGGLDEAIDMVERVHSHGPFTHLRFPGQNLSLLQLLCIDVIAVLALLALLSAWVGGCIFRILQRLLARGLRGSDEKEKEE